MPGRILGIDYGERRIGLALSDPTQILASGLKTLDNKEISDPFGYLNNLIKQEDISLIVLGLPKNLDGSLGPNAIRVLEFKKELEEKTGLEVVTWDERFSSVEIARTLKDEKNKIKRSKKLVDQLSAVLILQGYLDRQNRENQNAETER